MKRRDFVKTISGLALWPIAARAQRAMPVIGFLNDGSPNAFAGRVEAFRNGLAEQNFVEGRNVRIEYRWAASHYDQLPGLAADLVRLKVDVIAAIGGDSSARVAKEATSAIPIVFRVGTDPIHAGLVASLRRPGGNVTGITSLNSEVMPKRFELLHELLPNARAIALLVNPTNTNAQSVIADAAAAVRKLGLDMYVARASSEQEIDAVFLTLHSKSLNALAIAPDVFFGTRAKRIASAALGNGVAAAYQYREFVADGGLLSYGGNINDTYRQAGVYVGRILKGEKPQDLPVLQSTKAELILNMQTARALNIAVPISLLGRADDVIE